MINYTNVCFYFDINDDLSKTIGDKIVDALKASENVGVLAQLDSDINQLVSMSDQIASDNEYSQKVYGVFYKHAFNGSVDVTPILYNVLLEHELKHLINTEHNDRNLIVQCREMIDNTVITEDNYFNVIQSFLMAQSNILDDLDYRTFFEMAKRISFGTNEIEVVRGIFTELYEKFPPHDSEYNTDNNATIRTLMNFGGTYNQAKELIKKYL